MCRQEPYLRDLVRLQPKRSYKSSSLANTVTCFLPLLALAYKSLPNMASTSAMERLGISTEMREVPSAEDLQGGEGLIMLEVGRIFEKQQWFKDED